jgi:hypothetical protein
MLGAPLGFSICPGTRHTAARVGRVVSTIAVTLLCPAFSRRGSFLSLDRLTESSYQGGAQSMNHSVAHHPKQQRDFNECWDL